MIQEEIDFDSIYCYKCGDELIKDQNWVIHRYKIHSRICHPCDKQRKKDDRIKYKKANTDPNKVWDPNYNKICPGCKEEKNAEQYFKRNYNQKDGYHSRCTPCQKEYDQTIPVKFKNMRYDAKKRGYEWTLEQHDTSALFLSNCYYCGKPSQEKVKLHGLDRVENDRGYHLDNVVPCCYDCNIAKAGQTQEDFIDMCKRVSDRHYKTYTKDASEWIKVYVENMQVGEIKEENFIDPIW